MSENPNTQSQTQTQKEDENTFPIRTLREFSPYRVVSIDTVVKKVEGTQKDSGRTYSFDSKNHVVTIVPQKNETVSLKVKMFDQEYQNLRAIATLYGGFDKCWITTQIDPSSTTRNLKLLHTGTKRA